MSETVTVVSAVFTPPALVPTPAPSRTVPRKFSVRVEPTGPRAPTGIVYCDQHRAGPIAPLSAGHAPVTLVLLVRSSLRRGKSERVDAFAGNERNSGPAVTSGMLSARCAPRSRCSKL